MIFSHFNALSILAQAEAPAGAQGGNPIGTLLPIVLMFVIFYFVLIRPQKKKQDDLRKQIEAMQIGDDVVTAGGIHGTVTNKNNDKGIVTVRVADGVKIRFDKASINKVIAGTRREKDGDAEEVEVEVEEEVKKD